MSALGRTCAGVGSAIVTIVTVMAVSAIGSAATSNSADNETLNVSNATAYVVEMDETDAATGNVKTLTGNVTLNITANKSEFDEAISFNANNVKYDAKVGSLTYSSEDSEALTLKGLDVAMDSADGEAVIAIYVTSDEYNKITDGDSTSINISSKKEVERVGFKWFSLIIAVLFFAFILITCLFIKEKSTVDVQTAKVGDMFKALLQNDQAMAMVITIVLVNSATYITSNLLIYFFKYDLGGANWQGNYTTFNTFAGACQILAMMALFPLLRKWFSTMKIFYICIFSAIGGYIVLLIMALTGTSIVYPFFAPGFFIMAAVGMLNVIVTVFLANTVDYGELKNNRRDESVIFSMQTFVVKLASGIAALAASICLSVFNISESENTYEALDGSLIAGLKGHIADICANGATVVSNNSVIGLRFVMTVLPVGVLVVALIIFKARYKLTDEKLDEITKQLAAKKVKA
ncbi:MAG: MFS transporter [Lachnospiraceae bacterium]|nr:MFS transporter [Lachnospiraceae bacterium]